MGHYNGVTRRLVWVILLCLAWAACGGDKLATTVTPPAPNPPPHQPEAQPAPATPEVVAAVPLAPAEESPPEPLPLESPSDPAAILENDLAEALAELEDAGKDDPEAPALEAEEGALLDEIVRDLADPEAEAPVVSLSREELLQQTDSELPLVLNDQVARLVKYFTEGRGQKILRLTLGRSGAYREMIDRILEEEDVPPELFYLAQAESGFRPKARSYARATGMWQFMAFRGKQYGLRQDRYLEERYDAEKATRAAARHLKDLHIEFQDWYLTMAAYNAGPNRIKRAIARGNTRDYWEMCRRQLLPRQTRNYIPIILAMTYIGKNLELYDLGTIDYAPTRRYDSVETNSEITFELVADITGSSVSEVEALNPALLRSATPPYDYELRLPEGSSETFVKEIDEIPAEKRIAWRRHTLAEGEALEQIAKRFNVTPTELLAVNGLDPDSTLEPGLKLNVPTTTKLRIYRTAGGAGGLLEPGTGRYKIARGDTLGGIARRFGVSVAQLRSWNGLPNTRIRAGRYLIVRPNGVGAPAPATVASNGSYKVRGGDTLGNLARRFGTTVNQLKSWNGLTNSRINIGQQLRVPGAKVTPAPQAQAPSAAAAIQPTPAMPSNSPAGAPGQYRIRSGDTLGGIADRFGVTAADLRSWNGIRGSRIRAGKFLTVRPLRPGQPAGPAPAAQAPAADNARRYTIRSGDTLEVIARRHGATVDQLKQWNNLRTSRIRSGSSLIVGTGASRPTSSAPTRTASTQAGPEQRYRVRSGDTLGGIADRYGVSAGNLRQWNGIRGSTIHPGDSLIVKPGSRAAASTPAAPAKTAAPRAVSASNPGQYTIRPGDTLGGIASRFGVSASELRAWNGIRGSRIRAGATLQTKTPSAEGGQYQIQRGDTLAVIARRFNVSVSDLKRWNGLTSSRIRAGTYLTIRPATSGDD